MNLQNDMLLAKLESDLLIYEVKLKTERNYCMNSQMQVVASITEQIIKEIKRQIKTLKQNG